MASPLSAPAISRRDLLRVLAAMAAGPLLRPASVLTQVPGPLLTRRIPSSGEELPISGLGSWITFNVGNDPEARDDCAEVMRNFFALGGRLIDSSPMYGSSQAVIGHGLKKLGKADAVFSAEKVWTSGGGGRGQVEETRRRWGWRSWRWS